MRGWVSEKTPGCARRSQRAFSLIEVIIVAAILAILSGIGLISFQWVMDNARRKATIAEARQITTSLEFAYQDIGIFPKLNYLIENLTPFLPASGDGVIDTTIHNDSMVYNGFDYIGRVRTAAAPRSSDNTFTAYSRRITDKWAGPYWALSPTSKSSGEGPAGYVEMEIPSRNNTVRRWPMDQYGHPYVVYLLEQYDDDNNPDTLNVRFLQIPTVEPNFAAAVVSYGNDGLPGVLVGAAQAERERKERQRLYVELFPKRRYRLLTEADYTLRANATLPFDTSVRERLEAYSEMRFKNVAGYTAAGLPGINYDLVGITDALPTTTKRVVASDDIIIEF